MNRCRSVLHLGLFASGLLCLSHLAQAADIYRWTDAQGRVHLTDRPPEKAVGPVIKEDSRKYEVSPAERDAALRRAQADRDRLNAMESSRRPASAPKAPASEAAGAKAAASQAAPAETACARKLREFDANASCYAPFRNANGSMKPGAVEKCGAPVQDPAGECPRR